MKRPTIRLSYVLELVATAAVCFSVVRSQVVRRGHDGVLSPIGGGGWVRLVGGSLMTGLALAGSVGLAVEAARGRRPPTWGLGRWIWSIAGLYMLFSTAILLTALVVNRSSIGGMSPVLGEPVRRLIERTAVYQFFGGFGWAIAALCATSMVARAPHDPEPDAREWAGRLFASLTVALNIADPLMRAAGL